MKVGTVVEAAWNWGRREEDGWEGGKCEDKDRTNEDGIPSWGWCVGLAFRKMGTGHRCSLADGCCPISGRKKKKRKDADLDLDTEHERWSTSAPTRKLSAAPGLNLVLVVQEPDCGQSKAQWWKLCHLVGTYAGCSASQAALAGCHGQWV